MAAIGGHHIASVTGCKTAKAIVQPFIHYIINFTRCAVFLNDYLSSVIKLSISPVQFQIVKKRLEHSQDVGSDDACREVLSFDSVLEAEPEILETGPQRMDFEPSTAMLDD